MATEATEAAVSTEAAVATVEDMMIMMM